MELYNVIENLINGNLNDAKRAAKRYSWRTIHKTLHVHRCWSYERASAAADYLKGEGTFQAFCDAK